MAIAANSVANEAVATVNKPKVSVTGADLTEMAAWEEAVETEGLSLFGTSRWSCATGDAGTDVCVPVAEADGIRERDVFSCAYGTGGPIVSAVSQDDTTLYCRRI
ncbi:MAG: hypothetical protein AAFQ51_11850 [Pseudomonadota bacterium]